MEQGGDILALVRKRTVLLDGAMGTMLMAEGLTGGEMPEKWNLDKPEVVKSIHRRYFEAGSDAVTTNTFGGNRLKLREGKRDYGVSQINAHAAELAKAVSPLGRFVGGDIGPSGQLIAPLGKISEEQLEEVFSEQARALIAGGADYIIIETIFSLQEALAALRGARRAAQHPIFVSMTYEQKDRGFFTLMGETPEVCTKALEQEGADAIGANCTLQSREMIPLARVLRGSTSLPVFVQPNAGKPIIQDNKTVYTQDTEDFAKDVYSMVEEGVNVVGGCCGTTPAFISVLHKRLFGA
jgi:methionine synthase I (cobalamin-dependent)